MLSIENLNGELTEEQLKLGGIKPELIRLSIGIENINDIIEDIRQALNKTNEVK